MGVQEINGEGYNCKGGGNKNLDGEKWTVISFKICILQHIWLAWSNQRASDCKHK